jgi:hypothetical protein
LLGVNVGGNSGVINNSGDEIKLNMYSFNFYEFLLANGLSDDKIKSMIQHVKTLTTIPKVINDEYEDWIKKYIIVGGMPQSILTFLETKDYKKVFEVQRRQIEDYRSDIAKYAPKNDKIRALKCYDSAHNQLLKEFSKFQYSLVEKGKGSRQYENPLN